MKHFKLSVIFLKRYFSTQLAKKEKLQKKEAKWNRKTIANEAKSNKEKLQKEVKSNRRKNCKKMQNQTEWKTAKRSKMKQNEKL